jgi:hypothetical protein
MNRPDLNKFLIQCNKNYWVVNEPKSTLELDFIAFAGFVAEYVLEQEQKALLMEKAFDISLDLGFKCPAGKRIFGETNETCTKKESCRDCRRNYFIQEAQRQWKEDNNG